ncbi:MAG: hypothetical protein OXC62_11750 [Aestuariivita sp.]|nr:hypothetical protein [Aestuariivita sp.]
MRTSVQVEPVDGMCLDAKDRMNGAVRCAVSATDQQSERRYRTTNDTRLSPHPESGDDDPHRYPLTPRSPAQY